MGHQLIFLSYSHRDEEWKEQLLPHLGVLQYREGVEVWHDRKIDTGTDWDASILTSVDHSVAAILLISPQYLASQHIRTVELPRLLRLRQEKGLKLIPVLIRSCAWQSVESLSKMQVFSAQGRALSECTQIEIDNLFSKLVEEIFTWLSSQSVSTTPIVSHATTRTNISTMGTSFIGRQQELQALKDLFMQDETRLVTLTGPPGIGKTRLAKQLGRMMLSAFPGGCWFADLTESVTEAGIAYAIAQTFSVPLVSAHASPQSAVVEFLQPRGALLLILDNFEQIVRYAQSTVGTWLEELPEIRFLVTSRELLNLYAEREYRVDSLPIPSQDLSAPRAEDLAGYESVHLFIERARQSRPDFSLDDANSKAVARICRELQGVPLALEIAAARLRIASPAQIAEKLGEKLRLRGNRRDQPDRQKTLFDAIDWSYQLLNPWEQSAFLQMCTFRGDFFLKAAEQVVDLSRFQDVPPPSVEDVVQSLYEKSLLKSHETPYGLRFDMYVAIQDYGREVWANTATPEQQEALAQRWADFYIPYAHYWNEKIHTAEGGKALDLLSFELENLFSIQDWFIDHGDADIAAEAILAFAETMAVRGPAHLRVPRLELSLRKLPNTSLELRIRLMTALSAAHWSRGQWNEASEFADQAVELAKGLGFVSSAAAALRQQGRIRTDRGSLRRALDSLEKAKEMYWHFKDYSGIALIDTDIAGIFDRLGDLQKSLDLLVEAEDMARRAGDDSQRATVFNRRGLALWHHGYPDKALGAFREAERINQTLGARGWVAAHQTNQGLALADLSDIEAALLRFASAEKIHRDLGNQAWAAVNYGGWGRALIMRNQPDDIEQGLELIAKAEDLSKRVYYPENISLHAGDKGRALLLLGRYSEARKAVGTAVALERTIGANKDLRHFCNLVTLARVDHALGRSEDVREAITRARQLQRKLAIASDHRVRKVREDLLYLEEFEQLFAEEEEWPVTEVMKLFYRCSGTKLEQAQIADLADSIMSTFDECTYEYPWTGLEEELASRDQSSIRLLGYGSLLNQESAARTFLSTSPDRFLPAVAFGVVRLFNYEMPDELRTRYRPISDPLFRGLLNAYVTGSLTNAANGTLIEVDLNEIDPLRKREVGYDLKPIVCIEWNGREGARPILAYILSCPDRLWKGKRLIGYDLHPHPDYFELCYKGAACFSESFRQFWLETTFLADGETKVALADLEKE
ncbi:MAG TPA: TIR domain-containing protein [Thermoanaerobaculia bacterium]